jgi:glycosyltransferase involved in cell wall biosynthesis
LDSQGEYLINLPCINLPLTRKFARVLSGNQQNESPGLVILSPGFPSDELDTTCLPPIQQFCRMLKAEYPHLRVTVIAFQYPFHRANYTWHGIEVFSIGGKNRNKLFRLLTWMKVKARLQKICKGKNIKGVLALWLTETALVGRSFAISKGLKFYGWSQGQDAKKANGYIFRSGIKASEIIAISDFNAKEISKNHRLMPFMVAPAGVNQDAFPGLNTGEREIHLLGVGSLIPLKNYEAFVKTAHALKKIYPHINAVIVGSGKEERNLIDLINRLGLQHNLKLVGALPHQQVLSIMNRSRVLLHPSAYEGMGAAMIEALYSGCSVVSFFTLADRGVKNVTTVSSEAELLPACRKLLSQDHKAERVLAFDMKDTVHRIAALYL